MGDKKTDVISVDALTLNVLNRLACEIQNKSILVEKQLPRVCARVVPSVLDRGIAQMIENAITTTPAGGVVHITLVPGNDDWELEVADSVRNRFEKRGDEAAEREDQLAHRSNSVLAETAASMHGGEFRSFRCPMGGTAKVLRIPCLR